MHCQRHAALERNVSELTQRIGPEGGLFSIVYLAWTNALDPPCCGQGIHAGRVAARVGVTQISAAFSESGPAETRSRPVWKSFIQRSEKLLAPLRPPGAREVSIASGSERHRL